MNLIEATLNVEYLYLRHFSSRTVKLQPGQKEHHYHGHAPIVGFATAVMTCAKTSLYIWQGMWRLFAADVKTTLAVGDQQDITLDGYSGHLMSRLICKYIKV